MLLQWDMKKINLLVSESDMNSFCSVWLQPSLKDFNIVYYDKNTTYDKKSTVLVVGCLLESEWYKPLYNDGYKMIIDNLWELPKTYDLDAHVCTNSNWFWYNESLWYSHRKLNEYTPNRSYTQKAFVPMNLQKPFRDRLFDIINKNKDQFLFSYRARDFYLPNDDKSQEWQRFFNADWYDNTFFSVVAETIIDNNLPVFITEKTFKPIAFYHPFMILGQNNVLNRLKLLGFQTYENLFDESYDTADSLDDKLKIIENNISQFDKKSHDAVTLQKLQHNHSLFFDKKLVLDKLQKEIIEPIIDYAET